MEFSEKSPVQYAFALVGHQDVVRGRRYSCWTSEEARSFCGRHAVSKKGHEEANEYGG